MKCSLKEIAGLAGGYRRINQSATGFRAVSIFRYESSIGWLDRLRQTNRLACFTRESGAESLVRV